MVDKVGELWCIDLFIAWSKTEQDSILFAGLDVFPFQLAFQRDFRVLEVYAQSYESISLLFTVSHTMRISTRQTNPGAHLYIWVHNRYENKFEVCR